MTTRVDSQRESVKVEPDSVHTLTNKTILAANNNVTVGWGNVESRPSTFNPDMSAVQLGDMSDLQVDKVNLTYAEIPNNYPHISHRFVAKDLDLLNSTWTNSGSYAGGFGTTSGAGVSKVSSSFGRDALSLDSIGSPSGFLSLNYTSAGSLLTPPSGGLAGLTFVIVYAGLRSTVNAINSAEKIRVKFQNGNFGIAGVYLSKLYSRAGPNDTYWAHNWGNLAGAAPSQPAYNPLVNNNDVAVLFFRVDTGAGKFCLDVKRASNPFACQSHTHNVASAISGWGDLTGINFSLVSGTADKMEIYEVITFNRKITDQEVNFLDTDLRSFYGLSTVTTNIGSSLVFRPTPTDTIKKWRQTRSFNQAPTAPTTGDNETVDYVVGSIWVETTTPAIYILVDAAAGTWRQLTLV